MGGAYSPGQANIARKTVTFTGAAGAGAAGTPVSVFSVTGEVLIISLVAKCTVNLTEAAPTATVALGVTGNTVLFIAATNSVDIDAEEFWVDTGPDPNGVALPAALKDVVITDNVIITPATQNTTAGAIDFTILYVPVSANGAVVAA